MTKVTRYLVARGSEVLTPHGTFVLWHPALHGRSIWTTANEEMAISRARDHVGSHVWVVSDYIAQGRLFASAPE
jgi:hypothetical protein